VAYVADVHAAGSPPFAEVGGFSSPIGAETLWEQLLPLLPGLSVEVVRSVPSTNTALLARARVSAELEVTDGDVQVRRSVEAVWL